jgi:ubiquinone/menaquinone biosynthesis C-methylase UbiE
LPSLNSTEQVKNYEWWSANPMLYNWEQPLSAREGTKEFFEEIDHRFFNAIKKIAHPLYPSEVPFNRLIDYSSLKGKKMLEVGCGSGANAALFARCGAIVTAIDITDRAVELTKKRFSVYGLNGEVLKADAEDMPFDDESFDYIWSWGVIHHTANMNNSISEIYRVLKQGGSAQIMVYHKNSFRYWILGGVYHGIIKGKLFKMSLDEVNKSFTDGYIARHLTKKEAKDIFKMFSSIKLSVLDQGDHFLPLGKINRFLEKIIPGKIFSGLDAFFMKRFGWFLFIDLIK